jgi:hypothetical protein
MPSQFPPPKVDQIYVSIFAIAVAFSWILHEFMHWIVGKVLGYPMVMTLNSGYLEKGKFENDGHYQLISIAGPIFTVGVAVFVFMLMKNHKRPLLYPFLFTSFYMRMFAAVISVLNPNDEARVSSYLGIGKFTLPIIVTGLLFFLVYKISKEYKFNWQFNLANLGLAILFTSMIILTDMYLKVRLL